MPTKISKLIKDLEKQQPKKENDPEKDYLDITVALDYSDFGFNNLTIKQTLKNLYKVYGKSIVDKAIERRTKAYEKSKEELRNNTLSWAEVQLIHASKRQAKS